MSVITKKRKESLKKLDKNTNYNLKDAIKLLKDITYTNFDASVDLDIRLNVDPRKANQMVRGTVTLPHGTGKTKKVLVLCSPDKEDDAKNSGADYVGLDEYIEKIKTGWLDFEAVIATPNVMVKIAPIAKILGPRGLMPNPKSGTVTMDIAKTINDIKKGKIEFKVDKYGIVHSSIGRISFDNDKILENANELINAIIKVKPSGVKGTYIKSITLSSTMSPGIKIDTKSL